MERDIEQEGESTEDGNEDDEGGRSSTPVPIPGGNATRDLHRKIQAEREETPLSPTAEDPPKLDMPPSVMPLQQDNQSSSTSSTEQSSSSSSTTPLSRARTESDQERPQSPTLESRKEAIAIQRIVSRCGWKMADVKVVRLEKGSFLCPGFIDTHTVSSKGSFPVFSWVGKNV